MKIDLSKIGMEKGMQYESIITTEDCDGNLNAAPMGVLCRGPKSIMCRIFKGRTTLENIVSKKEFVVNISEDPELFTWSLLDNLQADDFNEDKSIKNIDCYFKCEVTDLKEAVKKSDPIRKKGEAIVIKANVVELVINKPVKAYNRSFSYVLESLVNFSRLDIADDIQREYYLKSFNEAYRVIKKVGSKKDRESMNKIKDKIKEKGIDV